MTDSVAFTTSSEIKTQGALAVPSGSARVPALIVIHEWFGLNDDIRRLCQRFADAGFLALAVDLYGGKVATESQQALALANELQTPVAMEVVAGALRYLKAHPRCNGKVGITGFCLGGSMALAAACNVEGLSAVVPYYGLPMAKYADWSLVRAPIQGHFAQIDAHVPREKVLAATKSITAAGGQIETFFYNAGHAFMREGDPSVYDAESAQLAWKRTLAFLHQHLASAAEVPA